jgi:hypothetical protein
MADGDRIIIGQANTASNPGNETTLSRNAGTARTVFVARNLNVGDGIHGEASGSSTGVQGTSASGTGVMGNSPSGVGVEGFNISGGVGIRGNSLSGVGVEGVSSSAQGVQGYSFSGFGVGGTSNGSIGVSGFSLGGIDVSGIGVNGTGSGIGVFGHSPEPGGDAGNFLGHVQVNGSVDVTGNKNFKIDHPLDPENRYLSHTCVESSEMKNVYDGVARLDKGGAAWVELPEWFEALNGDVRYQLTAVGGAAPNLHVAEEISENRFKIAGGEEGMKVCWQLTGSRKDRWATANPFEVEQEKPEEERGRYLDPSLYDAPEERRVMIGPIAETLRAVSTSPSGKEAVEALRRRMEEEQRPPQPSGIDFARLQEERLRQMMRQQPPPPRPPRFPPPPPSMMPPSFDFARLEEEHRRHLDELRRLVEEQRQEMEEQLRRRRERQEEEPPEST